MHSEDVGYAIIQKYWMASLGTHRVHIAVGDLGRGIEATLTSRYTAQQLQCQQESDFLVRALDRQYSSRPATKGGGAGLAHIRSRVAASNGLLILRSGTSRIWVYEGGIIQDDKLAYVPGVQVFITAYGTSDDWRRPLV